MLGAPLGADTVRERLGLLPRSQAWCPALSMGETPPVAGLDNKQRQHRLLLPVVHVQTLPGVDHKAHVLAEAKTCLENGADGVLLCAWHPPPDEKVVSEMFALPPGFPGAPGTGKCKAVAAASGRKFGAFAEKTLVCDSAARQAIDQLCWQGGFTQAWEETDSTEEFTMTKIPAIILVKLMLGLAADQEQVVKTLVGAYAICMAPDVRTCMNVIVGRRPDGRGGFVLDKFSLYYPDNSVIPGDTWDLLHGYSFRTAALSGSLNRAGLHGLGVGSIPVAEGTEFDAAKHGLVIDAESAYEDCAYVEIRESETNEDREKRIDGMVKGMVAAYGSQGILSLSYDPAEQQEGITTLESEWSLLKRVTAGETMAAPTTDDMRQQDEIATPVEVNECFAAVRAAYPNALLGINYLRDAVCVELLPSDADLLWTDYGAGCHESSVEHARCARERVAIQRLLRAEGGRNHLVHLGAFAFPKGGEEPLTDQELPAAAVMAKSMLEVPTSSGPSTGVPVDIRRAARLRLAVGDDSCLAIASGVDQHNCKALLPYFDIFMVNSSLLMTLPQKQGRHFLPWTCPQCTVVETSYPTMCDCCDFNRQSHPSYVAALAAAGDPTSRAYDALDRLDPGKVRCLADLVHGSIMEDEI